MSRARPLIAADDARAERVGDVTPERERPGLFWPPCLGGPPIRIDSCHAFLRGQVIVLVAGLAIAAVFLPF